MLAAIGTEQLTIASKVYTETLQNMSALVIVFVVVIVVLLLMGFLTYKLAIRFLNDAKEQNNIERASHESHINSLLAGIDKLVKNSEKCSEDSSAQIIQAINISGRQIIEGQKLTQAGQATLENMIKMHDERVRTIESFAKPNYDEFCEMLIRAASEHKTDT
jgi:predicted PurR-regulated permease PerM